MVTGGAIAVLSVLCTFTVPDAITTQSRVEAKAPQQTTSGNYDTNAPAATTTPAAPAAKTPAAPAAAPAPAEGQAAQ